MTPREEGLVSVALCALATAGAIAACLWLFGCGAATPTPADEGRLGAYTAAMGACEADLIIAKARVTGADGGIDSVTKGVLWARWVSCSRAVDSTFGIDAGPPL